MKPVRAGKIIGRWWSEPRSAREHFKAKVARKSGARCPKGIETVLNIAKNPCFKVIFNIISPVGATPSFVCYEHFSELKNY